MLGSAFFAAALATAAGVSAQVLAAHLAIPSVVVLLAAGILLGPDGVGWLDPQVFGGARSDIVSLAVTVILFDGGLGLDLDRLREQWRALGRLLGAGVVLSMAVGTVAARWLLGTSWEIAILYGALMTVTGPTVVTPLVSRLPLARATRELLIGEGVLIDPVGAIIALVVADALLGHSGAVQSSYLVLVRLGTGAVVGIGLGIVVSALCRRQLVPEHLVNPFVLGSALLGAAVASQLSTEAGLMAAVTQGVTLANRGVRTLGRLRAFKEALTVVLLGFLFVVLTADVRLAAIADLGAAGLAVVGALMWIARPLTVLAGTWGSGFTHGERALMAWICPRGIVAASVASLFHILLEQSGTPGGTVLEALVFLTVATTVAWQGLTAPLVTRLFRADRTAGAGVVIVGAEALGRLLARTLAAAGRPVVLIDRSPWNCSAARRDGLATYEGDALSLEALEEVGARHAHAVIAVTRNRELNALLARRVEDHFKVERILALAPAGDAPDAPALALFPGGFPGVDEVNAMLETGRLAVREHAVPEEWGGRALGELDYEPGEFALVLARESQAMVATADLRLVAGDRLFLVEPAPEGTAEG